MFGRRTILLRNKGVYWEGGIVMNPTDRSELALELSGTVGKRFLCALKSLIFVIL